MTKTSEKNVQGASAGVKLADIIRGNVRQYTMIGALLIIWLIFTISTQGIFITSRNLSILFVQMCTTGILTGGMLMVMVSGNIDLAAGSVCGTLGALVAYMMASAHFSPIIAIIITIAVGMVVGAWHGFWVAFRRVPAFIVTLASQIAFRGLTLMVTDGATIGEFDPSFKLIGQGYLPDLTGTAEGFHMLTLMITVAAIVIFVTNDLRARKMRVANGFAVLSAPLQIAKLVLISAALGAVGFIFAEMGFPTPLSYC